MGVCEVIIKDKMSPRSLFRLNTPGKKTKRALRKQEKLEKEKRERVNDFPMLPLLVLAALAVFVVHKREWAGLKPMQAVKGFGMVVRLPCVLLVTVY